MFSIDICHFCSSKFVFIVYNIREYRISYSLLSDNIGQLSTNVNKSKCLLLFSDISGANFFTFNTFFNYCSGATLRSLSIMSLTSHVKDINGNKWAKNLVFFVWKNLPFSRFNESESLNDSLKWYVNLLLYFCIRQKCFFLQFHA